METTQMTITTAPAQLQRQPQITSDLYAEYVKFIDATPATVRAYTGSLRQFMKYLNYHGISQPTRETVITYREELKTRCKPTTVQNYIEALKIFFAWTAQTGFYPNIAERIKGARISKEHKKDYLTSQQIRNVLNGIDRSTLQGKRDYALIVLMTVGGLRTIEASRADIQDISKAGSSAALYIQGKGREDKADYIKLPLEIESALRSYLKGRIDADPLQPLFISLSNNSHGERLSPRSISGIVKQHIINAGYESDRITAHSLRHSAVTISLLEGNSLQETQQFARHRNIATTQIYAHNLDREKSNCENSISNSIFMNEGKD